MLLHANLEKKLPQNLDAEINTTAPPSAHPKLSPYNSPINKSFVSIVEAKNEAHMQVNNPLNPAL